MASPHYQTQENPNVKGGIGSFTDSWWRGYEARQPQAPASQASQGHILLVNSCHLSELRAIFLQVQHSRSPQSDASCCVLCWEPFLLRSKGLDRDKVEPNLGYTPGMHCRWWQCRALAVASWAARPIAESRKLGSTPAQAGCAYGHSSPW